MKHVIRSLLGVCLVLASWLAVVPAAHALIPTTSGTQYQLGSRGWFSDKLASCSDYMTFLEPQDALYLYSDAYINASGNCQWKRRSRSSGAAVSDSNQTGFQTRTGQFCPANSTASGSACQCNAGYAESGNQCVQSLCAAKMGKVGVTNWTQGYSRTPDEGDVYGVGPVTLPPASGEVCDAGCKVALQTSGPGVNFYVSQAPTASGLYRRSADYPNLNLGTDCTPGAVDAPAQKTSTVPACPGTVGEVNGKTVCVGTAASPVTTTPIERPSVPPIAGNPAAGAKPSTGDGSGTGSAGRTPTGGDGGPAGGPAGAAVGGRGGSAGGTSDGKGTTDKPADGKEQAACGAPGQPVCAVKVDEKGTPEGVGTSFDAAKQKSDDSYSAQAKTVTDATASTYKPTWDFSFSLPTGCTAFDTEIEGFKLDPCRYQSTIHDLMSLVWAAITVFTIIGMVGRTIRGT